MLALRPNSRWCGVGGPRAVLWPACCGVALSGAVASGFGVPGHLRAPPPPGPPRQRPVTPAPARPARRLARPTNFTHNACADDLFVWKGKKVAWDVCHRLGYIVCRAAPRLLLRGRAKSDLSRMARAVGMRKATPRGRKRGDNEAARSLSQTNLAAGSGVGVVMFLLLRAKLKRFFGA